MAGGETYFLLTASDCTDLSYHLKAMVDGREGNGITFSVIGVDRRLG